MLNWVSQLFKRRSGLRPAPHLQAIATHNDTIWPNLSQTQRQTRVYQQSPWVYMAINRIAEAAALAPLQVLRLVGEQTQSVERHPLEVLLDAPNPYLSRFELFEQTFGMLELTGNAFWFLAGDANGVPCEIWPLRPDRVSIVPDPADYVRGYIYELDGQRIPLETPEVVHFKRWHPANDYYGLSALEAAHLTVSSDLAMAEWNRNTFSRDNGVPAGIVSVKDFVPDADFERIKREWRASYGGPQRRTAFLRGGSIEWHNIGLSHSELDFLQGRQAHRDELLNIFGIPVGLVSPNATEANAKVAERMFIERTLWPKLVRVAQKLTQELVPFWPGDYVAAFDDIRPTDTQARLDEIRTAYPILSINEIRQRYYNLAPVTWGVLPVEMAQAQETASAAAAATATNATTTTTTASTPTVINDSPSPAEQAKSAPAEQTKSALSELTQWEHFTLKRWGRQNGRQLNGRAFEVRALPDETAFEVSAGLLAAESEAEARQVFQAARQTLHTEMPLH